MLRKISNYEYRENNTKNTSDSSSGCEDDFDADDVHDGDEQDYSSQINEMTLATKTSLNLSPMPHFPPPPDYPPPTSTSTRNKCRYFYYENGKTYLSHSNQHHIGSIDRDCDYTTDGNDVCSQYRQNTFNETNSRSVNNSSSSTSRSSNNSVLVHNTMKNTQTQVQYQTKNLDAIELCTTEQEKQYPFRLHSATAKMNKVNYCTNTGDFSEKDPIRFGGAATIEHDCTNIEPQVSLSIQK